MEEMYVYFVSKPGEVEIRCGECGFCLRTVECGEPEQVNVVTLEARTRVHLEDQHGKVTG